MNTCDPSAHEAKSRKIRIQGQPEAVSKKEKKEKLNLENQIGSHKYSTVGCNGKITIDMTQIICVICVVVFQ